MTELPDPSRNRRGAEVRARLLDAGLGVFARGGYRAATTREIAAEAGVNLPAIAYYFGGKEGLYLACARAIVERYEVRMGSELAGLAEALPTLAPEEARRWLKRVLAMLAELLVTERDAERWTAFALREIAERGPAYDLLSVQLWLPGVALVTALVERTGAADPAMEAILLVSGLAMLTVARPIALAHLGWDTITPERLARVNAVMVRRIDALG